MRRFPVLLAAWLTAVLADDGYAQANRTAENDAPGADFQPFGPLANPGAALLLGFEAPDSGILRLAPRTPEVGEEVPIGTVLAYLLGPGEGVPLAGPTSKAQASASSTASVRSGRGAKTPPRFQKMAKDRFWYGGLPVR